MLRDMLIFGCGLFAGVMGLMLLIRLPYWMHEHTRKEALRGRDGKEGRWLH